MKKLISILVSLFLISTLSAKAEVGIGITGAMYSVDISGTETTRQSSQANKGDHSEDIEVGEIFVEAITDSGMAIGINYIPTRDMGSKSRTDSNSDGDSGTYTAKAELDNVIQIYVDTPTYSVGPAGLYAKLGIQTATILTGESLNSGSTYPDEDVFGYTIGIGAKGDLTGGMYYKAEITYTDFEDYEADSSTSPANKVEADLEAYAAKFSLGYKF